MQSTSTAAHNPGGKVLLPLPIWIRGAAVLGGQNEEYRYELSRTWDEALPTILFVMMNPSTALLAFDDKSLRYRGLEVARLLSRHGARPIFALRLAQDETPCHPLYLPGSPKPVLWPPFEAMQ